MKQIYFILISVMMSLPVNPIGNPKNILMEEGVEKLKKLAVEEIQESKGINQIIHSQNYRLINRKQATPHLPNQAATNQASRSTDNLFQESLAVKNARELLANPNLDPKAKPGLTSIISQVEKYNAKKQFWSLLDAKLAAINANFRDVFDRHDRRFTMILWEEELENLRKEMINSLAFRKGYELSDTKVVEIEKSLTAFLEGIKKNPPKLD